MADENAFADLKVGIVQSRGLIAKNERKQTVLSALQAAEICGALEHKRVEAAFFIMINIIICPKILEILDMNLKERPHRGPGNLGVEHVHPLANNGNFGYAKAQAGSDDCSCISHIAWIHQHDMVGLLIQACGIFFKNTGDHAVLFIADPRNRLISIFNRDLVFRA